MRQLNGILFNAKMKEKICTKKKSKHTRIRTAPQIKTVIEQTTTNKMIDSALTNKSENRKRINANCK